MAHGIYGQYSVIVKVNGQAVGGFSEVTGLTTDSNVVDYREGDNPGASPRKVPGQHRFNVITLTRGVVNDAGFSAWLEHARTRQHLTIERYDTRGRLLWSRVLLSCAITEHRPKGLSAVEKITLTYHHHKPS